jgi:hypothetical protein
MARRLRMNHDGAPTLPDLIESFLSTDPTPVSRAPASAPIRLGERVMAGH